MSQLQVQQSSSKALAVITLIVRVLTLVFLLVSLIILVVNTATIKPLLPLDNFTLLSSGNVTVTFKDIHAYRYVLSADVIGAAYTFLQIPFAVHHVSVGKRMISHVWFLHFDLFGDEVILCLLASGVGAAFGATYDLKKNLDDWESYFKHKGIKDYSANRIKLDKFFDMAFISASFLLVAFVFSTISSIISTMALSKKNKN